MADAQFLHHLEGFIEITPDRDDTCPVHQGLCHFSKRHLAGREEHDSRNPGLCSIGCEACRGIPGTCTGNRRFVELECHTHPDGHSPVLERSGGIHPFVFCIQVREPDLFSDSFQMVERSTPFLQGDRRDGDRKELTVPPHRDRTPIPFFTPNGKGVEIVLHKEQVPAGTAGIDDLIRRIGSAALHAGEAIHALDLSGHRTYTHPVLQTDPIPLIRPGSGNHHPTDRSGIRGAPRGHEKPSPDR